MLHLESVNVKGEGVGEFMNVGGGENPSGEDWA